MKSNRTRTCARASVLHNIKSFCRLHTRCWGCLLQSFFGSSSCISDLCRAACQELNWYRCLCAVCCCCCPCFPGRTPGAGQKALPFTCRTSVQSRSRQQSFCAPAGLSHCCSSGKEAYIKKQGFCVPFKKYPACFDETLICLHFSLADSDLSSSHS